MTTPPPPPPPPPPSDFGPTPPGGYANNDEKTWALLTHFGGAAGAFVLGGVGGWIMPVITLATRGNQSPLLRAHAVQALNFQLTWTIVGVIGIVTACIVIGFFAIGAAVLMGVIFGIIAGIKANDGELYHYPASIKMIK
jgi:uncharacterized protein